MVGRAGLEPTTPCVSCKCATNCANGPECSDCTPDLDHHGEALWPGEELGHDERANPAAAAPWVFWANLSNRHLQGVSVGRVEVMSQGVGHNDK